MESLRIVATCVLAAVAYGIVHDQITARICVEYFTVFHPPILRGTHSPTLLAFGWGVIATWWVGALLGIPLAIAARAGSRPKLSVHDLFPMIGRLLIVMGGCALVAGVAGFIIGGAPQFMVEFLPPDSRQRFVADWWAHMASYGSGFIGGVVLWVVAYRKRPGIAARQYEQRSEANVSD
ncbi:MAG TPA: hypothetical protein VFO39_12340 [Candidatus Sulfotelmatobacter sp.]|nr:hypothetical protein [Candidatus Sulfotelmatobacter sp.]